MEKVYHDLADRALKILERSQSYRVIILLIGAPGSGKTTVAQRVVDILNQRFNKIGEIVESGLETPIDDSFLRDLRNSNLPKYNPNQEIDYEDEHYVPTVERINKNDVVIRGRGGDDTAIKISSSRIIQKRSGYCGHRCLNHHHRSHHHNGSAKNEFAGNGHNNDYHTKNSNNCNTNGNVNGNKLNGNGNGFNHYGENSVKRKDENLFAQVLSMDGFHLPRSVLSKFKDSERAFQRRGSPFTFDSSLIVKLVENLNKTLQIKVIKSFNEFDIVLDQLPTFYIPDFDHSQHDPTQFGTVINPSSRILIMEGLYLLLNNPVWCDIAKILNSDVQVEDNHFQYWYQNGDALDSVYSNESNGSNETDGSKEYDESNGLVSDVFDGSIVSNSSCNGLSNGSSNVSSNGSSNDLLNGLSDDSSSGSPKGSNGKHCICKTCNSYPYPTSKFNSHSEFNSNSNAYGNSTAANISTNNLKSNLHDGRDGFFERNGCIRSLPIRQGQMTEFWKLIISDAKMVNRVGKRHLKSKIVLSLQDGEERVKLNDLPNGQKVNNESYKSDLNIFSIDDCNEF